RAPLFPKGSRLIVVDDGSSDRTAEVAEGFRGPLPLQLVRLERNQGPGAAFRAGFDAALADCPDDALVLTLEADTTGALGSLPTMLARAQNGADLVLADWRMVNVSLLRRKLSQGAGFATRHALGLQTTAVSSFQRVYKASLLREGLRRH